MRYRILPILFAMALAPGMAWGQGDLATTDLPSSALVCDDSPASASYGWVRAEYLLWWIKDGAAPPPMVTTGTGPPATFGILGPGTTVLFGGSNLDYGTFSGLRIGAGAWIDEDQHLGVEAGAFLLWQRSVSFEVVSHQGAPPLAIPFFNPVTGVEDRLPVASPAFALPGIPPTPSTGGIAITSFSRLWGAEALGVCRLAPQAWGTFDLLLGTRYLDLSEAQRFAARIVIDAGNGSAVDALGREYFETENRFYGAKLGGRLNMQTPTWSLNATAGVSLGATHEIVAIEGARRQFGTGVIPTILNRGAVFTEPTNIGRSSQGAFAVVPEGRLQAAFALGPFVQILAGYDVLFWSNVVRPGDQIDRTINISQRIGGTLVGPARPTPLFNETTFWAHGVTLGVQVRF